MRKNVIATQSGIGSGMGKTSTGNLGAIMANVPPRAKIAPEAPIPIERGDARRMKRTFPTMPPRKYTFRKFLSPISLVRKLPRKYRLIMLNIIWLRPPWTKRLVAMVQGRCRKLAGCKPKKNLSSGRIRAIIKTKTFATIKNQMALRLKAL